MLVVGSNGSERSHRVPSMVPDDDSSTEAALRPLLVAERARPGLTDARSERALGRVTLALAVALRSSPALAPDSPRPRVGASSSWAATVGGALLGAAIAMNGRAAVTSIARDAPPGRPAVIAAPSFVASAPPRLDGPHEATATPSARPRTTEAMPELESPLLERARAAMLHGRPSVALESLDAHARRFPRGRFEAEREAMRVQCLVAAGRTGEAREAAARFRARYRGSPLVRAIDAALDAAPDD